MVVQHFGFRTERCETCTKVIFNDLYIIYFWYRLCPIKMTSVIGMSNQKTVLSYRNPDCYSWKRFWSVIYISKINKATRKWNTRHKQLMILSFNNFQFSFTNEQFSIGNGNGFVNKYKLLSIKGNTKPNWNMRWQKKNICVEVEFIFLNYYYNITNAFTKRHASAYMHIRFYNRCEYLDVKL